MEVCSWYTYQTYVNALAVRISEAMQTERLQVSGIIGIARGGLTAAVCLSHILDKPFIGTIMAKTYTDDNKKQVTAIKDDFSRAAPDCLFVDDIIDTGSTAEALLGLYPQARIVAPVGKPTGLERVMTLGMLPVMPSKIVADNMWVKFPWEVQP